MNDIHRFIVLMPVHAPSHNVLVAIENGTESVGPLIEAILAARRVVSHKDCDFTIHFIGVKSLVEPG